MPQIENHSKEQGEILTILEGDNCSFSDGTFTET